MNPAATRDQARRRREMVNARVRTAERPFSLTGLRLAERPSAYPEQGSEQYEGPPVLQGAMQTLPNLVQSASDVHCV